MTLMQSQIPIQGAHYFFDPAHINMQGHVVNFNAAETKSLTDRCASWHVPYSTVEDELRRQNVSRTPSILSI